MIDQGDGDVLINIKGREYWYREYYRNLGEVLQWINIGGTHIDFDVAVVEDLGAELLEKRDCFLRGLVDGKIPEVLHVYDSL